MTSRVSPGRRIQIPRPRQRAEYQLSPAPLVVGDLDEPPGFLDHAPPHPDVPGSGVPRDKIRRRPELMQLLSVKSMMR